MKLRLGLFPPTAGPLTSVRRDEKSQNYTVSLPPFRSQERLSAPQKQGLPVQCVELQPRKDLSTTLKSTQLRLHQKGQGGAGYHRGNVNRENPLR